MRHFVAGLSPRFKSSQLYTLRSQLVQLFSSTIQAFTLYKFVNISITFLMFFCQKKELSPFKVEMSKQIFDEILVVIFQVLFYRFLLLSNITKVTISVVSHYLDISTFPGHEI